MAGTAGIFKEEDPCTRKKVLRRRGWYMPIRAVMKGIWSIKCTAMMYMEVYYMISRQRRVSAGGQDLHTQARKPDYHTAGCFYGLRVLDTDEYNRIRLHFAAELLQERNRLFAGAFWNRMVLL